MRLVLKSRRCVCFRHSTDPSGADGAGTAVAERPTMNRLVLAWMTLSAAAVLPVGCSCDPVPVVANDGGPTDGGPTDGGPTDASLTDGGPTDGGPMSDAGLVADAGDDTQDAGVADAGLAEPDVDAGEDADDAGLPSDAGVDDPLRTTTTTGDVQGHVANAMGVYLGIPYAEPPVGDLRLHAPVAVTPWDDTLHADTYGPSCPALFAGNDTSEDCLTLNVWRHLDGQPRPVMVWVYGGGYVEGETSSASYDAHDLAQDADVVVVTVNYRLGLLASLALPELQDEDADGALGNMGLLDLVEALRWIKANAAVFGGDPDNITVFGESAGALSTCALLGTPAADDLFHKAIVQSGNCALYMEPSDDAYAGNTLTHSEAVVDELGCATAEDRLQCLRDLDVDDYLLAVDLLGLVSSILDGGFVLGPTVDGVVLPERPYDRLVGGRAPERPLIAGSVPNEGSFFTAADHTWTEDGFANRIEDAVGGPAIAQQVVDLYPIAGLYFPENAYNDFVGEVLFICNTWHVANTLPNAYYYVLDDAPFPLMTPHGPLHSADVPYVFGQFALNGLAATPADERLSDDIQRAWGVFAHTGEPTFREETWPEARFGMHMRFDKGDDVTRSAILRQGRCDALQDLGVLPAPVDHVGD